METDYSNERTPILRHATAVDENIINDSSTILYGYDYNNYDSLTTEGNPSGTTMQTTANSDQTSHRPKSRGNDAEKAQSSYVSPMHKGSGNNKTDTEVHVYKRRWYILAVFSIFSNVQTTVWQTWGPISNSSERVFGWTDSSIAWLNNSGPLAYTVAGILFPWLLHVKGLRAAILGSALLMSVGCTFRVISDDPPTASILIHVGQLLNGASGPMAMGAMPYLSATWFPVHERVTATAIASSVGYFGTAVSFVVGPALVSDSKASDNSTNNHTHPGGSSGNSNGTSLDAIIDKEKKEIMHYMYYSCGVAWFVAIIVILYFPAKPPRPPCVSAVVQRDTFWQGIFSLRRKKYFIFIAITYGMSVGVTNTWVTVLSIILGRFDMSQSTAGWIGFYATVALCLTGVIFGKFADYFTRMMKHFIFVMYVAGALLTITFSLMYIDVIPYNTILLWATVIGGMSAINGAVPLLFELACEMAFPTGEGPTTGVMTYINNVFGLVFLLLFSIPDIGQAWMNWLLVASIVLCLPLIGLMKGKMRRLDIDEKDTATTTTMKGHENKILGD